MKITPEILEALQKAVSRFPNRNQFALKVGVPQHTLVRWLEGISKSIKLLLCALPIQRKRALVAFSAKDSAVSAERFF